MSYQFFLTSKKAIKLKRWVDSKRESAPCFDRQAESQKRMRPTIAGVYPSTDAIGIATSTDPTLVLRKVILPEKNSEYSKYIDQSLTIPITCTPHQSPYIKFPRRGTVMQKNTRYYISAQKGTFPGTFILY